MERNSPEKEKSTKATPHLPIPTCLLRSQKAKHEYVGLQRIPQQCNSKRVGRARPVRQRVGRACMHIATWQHRGRNRADNAWLSVGRTISCGQSRLIRNRCPVSFYQQPRAHSRISLRQQCDSAAGAISW